MKVLLKIIVYFLGGGLFGFTVARLGVLLFTDQSLTQAVEHFHVSDLSRILAGGAVAILSFLLSLLLHVVLHEGGHLLGGLCSGYRFVSFRVFSFTLYRDENGRFHVKRFFLAGTGGQCLMLPPDVPVREVPSFLYNIGGVLANMLAVALASSLFFMELPTLYNKGIGVFVVLGLIFALTNGMPLTLRGIDNDGKNALFLHRHPEELEAFVLQLRVNAGLQQGLRLQEMPVAWFDMPSSVRYSAAMQVCRALICVSLTVDRMEWERAYTHLISLHEHRDEMIPLLALEVDSELSFAALVTHRTDEARRLWTPRLEKYVTQHRGVMSSKDRVWFAKVLLMDRDRSGAERICQQVREHGRRYLMQGEVRSDLAVMEQMLGEFE